MRKRFLSTLMALALALSLLPSTALAAGDDPEAPVAKVNGTEYQPAEFQQAIEAAGKDGSTVELLRDYTLELGDSILTLSNYNITFDLGDHTLTINSDSRDPNQTSAVVASDATITVKNGTLAGSSYGHLIYSTNTGSLHMEDLTINYTGKGEQCMAISAGASASTFKDVEINATDAGCVEVSRSGKATFDNCTFETTTEKTGHPFTAVAASFGGTATINSGTYTGVYGLYVYNSGATIDVKNGTFTGTTAVLQADQSTTTKDSVITVADGSFTGAINVGASKAKIELSGGKYTADPTQYLADGYLKESISGEGYSYQVKVDPTKVIQLEDAFGAPIQKFASIKDALDSGEMDAFTKNVLKLLDDVTVEDTAISQRCTIDLNGFELSGSTITVPESASGLTIRGSGEASCALKNESGVASKLLLNGGSYSGKIEGEFSPSASIKFSATSYPDVGQLPKLNGYQLVLSADNAWYEYQPITYQIILHPNGGTLPDGFSETTEFPYVSTAKVILPTRTGENQITKTNSQFDGWYYDQDCSDKAASYSKGEISAYYIASESDDNYVLNLYAKWTDYVAEIEGGNQYTSLSSAIRAAKEGATVKLLGDASVSTALTIEKNITLDLNDLKLTNTYDTNSGKIEYSLITKGDVTIKNGTYDSTGASSRGIARYSGNLTLDGVTVSCNGLVSVADQAGGGTLTIKGSVITGNYAVATFADNCTVTISGSEVNGTGCGIYHNGGNSGLKLTVTDTEISTANDKTGVYVSGSADYGAHHTVTLTNCTISGGTAVEVKYTDVTLEKCSVTATAGAPSYVQNDNGATALGFAVVASDNAKGDTSPKPEGTITIKSGTYAGAIGLGSLIGKDKYPDFKEADYSISGGYFTVAPESGYLAENKAVLPSDNPAYGFMVGDAVDTGVEIDPAAGAPVVEVPETIEDDDKEAVKKAAQSVKDNGELAAAANTVLEQITEQQVTDAKAAIEESDSGVVVGDDETVSVYAQTYLSITPTAYSDAEGEKSLTLDIQPMYRVVATTAASADDIKVVGEAGEHETPNAVVLAASQRELTTIQNMTISITLPDGFVTGATTPVYVQHKGYEYTTTVSGDDTNGFTITFTNPHGFSEFTITTVSQGVVTGADGTVYTDFQAAVDAAKSGDTITVTKAAEGETFNATISGSASKSVKVENGTGGKITVTINGDTQTLDNGAEHTFTYTYTSSGTSTGGGSVTRYEVSAPSNVENGTVKVSSTRASAGSTVTITVTPDEGYELDALTVTGADGKAVALTDKGDGKFTFQMPRGKVSIDASFKAVEEPQPEPVELPFTDVAEGEWYYDAVAYAYENGLMTGTSATLFAPGTTTSRAMLATLLYRLEGSPDLSNEILGYPYADVDAESWYGDGVYWARLNGVVTGITAEIFDPNGDITREQMAVMLYRYAQYKGYDVTQGGMAAREYADYASVSSWAQYAVDWAVSTGLISGTSADTLSPQGSATRAEIATILMRFVETFAPAE